MGKQNHGFDLSFDRKTEPWFRFEFSISMLSIFPIHKQHPGVDSQTRFLHLAEVFFTSFFSKDHAGKCSRFYCITSVDSCVNNVKHQIRQITWKEIVQGWFFSAFSSFATSRFGARFLSVPVKIKFEFEHLFTTTALPSLFLRMNQCMTFESACFVCFKIANVTLKLLFPTTLLMLPSAVRIHRFEGTFWTRNVSSQWAVYVGKYTGSCSFLHPTKWTFIKAFFAQHFPDRKSFFMFMWTCGTFFSVNHILRATQFDGPSHRRQGKTKLRKFCWTEVLLLFYCFIVWSKVYSLNTEWSLERTPFRWCS